MDTSLSKTPSFNCVQSVLSNFALDTGLSLNLTFESIPAKDSADTADDLKPELKLSGVTKLESASGAWGDSGFRGSEELVMFEQCASACRESLEVVILHTLGKRVVTKNDIDLVAQMFTVGDRVTRSWVVNAVHENFKNLYRQQLGSELLCEMAYISETRDLVATLLTDNVMRCAVDRFGCRFIIACIETNSEHFMYEIKWTLVSQSHRLSVLKFGSKVVRKWISLYGPSKEQLRMVLRQHAIEVLNTRSGVEVFMSIVKNVDLDEEDFQAILQAIASLSEESKIQCRHLVNAIVRKVKIVVAEDSL